MGIRSPHTLCAQYWHFLVPSNHILPSTRPYDISISVLDIYDVNRWRRQDIFAGNIECSLSWNPKWDGVM